jgi:hypothetical protein
MAGRADDHQAVVGATVGAGVVRSVRKHQGTFRMHAAGCVLHSYIVTLTQSLHT